MQGGETQQVAVERLQGPWGMAPQTQKLIELLKAGKAGDKIVDEKLTETVNQGCAPGEPSYGHLLSAIKHVRKCYKLSWKRVAGGKYIACLDAGGCLSVVRSERSHIRKRSNVGIQQLKCASEQPMNNEQQTKCHAALAMFGGLACLAGGDTSKALEARAVTEAPSKAKMLEVFK